MKVHLIFFYDNITEKEIFLERKYNKDLYYNFDDQLQLIEVYYKDRTLLLKTQKFKSNLTVITDENKDEYIEYLI